MKKEYGQIGKEILQLREQGLSYREIQKELGCSKGTISYHLGKGQKEKTNCKQQLRRSVDPLVRRCDRFQETYKPTTYERIVTRDLETVLKNKCKRFRYISQKEKKVTTRWEYTELMEREGVSPTCYLTGSGIDWDDTTSYHLDHIVPRSRGGSNSLDNCGLASAKANQMKGDMTVEEMLDMCKTILEHNGYDVSHQNK
jgi:5-methylcytosine-specific restriction endonuclease McrA